MNKIKTGNNVNWTALTRLNKEETVVLNDLGQYCENLRSFNEWLIEQLESEDNSERSKERTFQLKSKIERFNSDLDESLGKKVEMGQITESKANDEKSYWACLNIDKTKIELRMKIFWQNFGLELEEIDKLIDKKESEVLNEFDKRFEKF